MKLSSLGNVTVEVIALPGEPEIMQVSVGAEHRQEVMHATTNKDETIDQFVMRLKGIFRALMNAVPRENTAQAPEEFRQKETWSQQKAAMKTPKPETPNAV